MMRTADAGRDADRGLASRRQAWKQNRKTPEAIRTRFDNRDASDTQLKLSRKALVHSTLLSFDEASVSPATNSGIDVGRPLIFQCPDLLEIGSPEFLWQPG
jgi:hypothetical protein